MKRDINILVLLLFSSICALAQPGYQGKKLTLSYNLGMSPGLKHFLIEHSKMQPVNTTHIGRIDYVIGRKKTLGLIFSHINTLHTTATIHDISLPFGNGNNNQQYNNYPYAPVINETIMVKGTGGGLVYRIFFSGGGNIAPLGKYVEFEGQYFTYSVYNESGKRNYATSEHLLAAISLGKQKIVLDRILLDVGLRFALFGTGFKYLSDTMVNDLRSYEARGYGRLFSHQFISFKVGLGLLAF